jgi:hypothetical protein
MCGQVINARRLRLLQQRLSEVIEARGLLSVVPQNISIDMQSALIHAGRKLDQPEPLSYSVA